MGVSSSTSVPGITGNGGGQTSSAPTTIDQTMPTIPVQRIGMHLS